MEKENIMKIFFIQFFKFTFLYYLKSFFYKKQDMNLHDVKKFWDNYDEYTPKNSKVILVECLEKFNPNMDSYYKLVAMLGKVYNIKVIALVSYKSYKETTKFLSFYRNIDTIEAIYRPMDFITKIKAIYILCKNYPFIYKSNEGFKLTVKGKEIGDLIYDEYLRVGRKETLRKPNLLFYTICLNAIYAHLRYEEIVEKHQISDIISIRDTYSHASYCRAGKNIDDITIWKNRAGTLASIRKLKAFTDFTFKPFYFELKHLEYIKENHSKDNILKMYDNLIDERKTGNVNTGDAAEIKLAHSQNEISSKEEFLKIYPLEKKTTVVIYSHIFVDAVRYPHRVIFSDHYTWLTETLQFLVENKDFNLFVKPHPSEVLYQLGKSVSTVVEEFNSKYKCNITILDKKIDSSVIFDLCDVIITGSGTIAMEAPCEGVKVITAGSNSYENTNAMFRSKTQKEYFDLLNKIEVLPEISQEQIFNSKIGFIWLNKIQYIESNISISLDKKLPMQERLLRLNNMYMNANKADATPLFERLLDDRIN